MQQILSAGHVLWEQMVCFWDLYSILGPDEWGEVNLRLQYKVQVCAGCDWLFESIS